MMFRLFFLAELGVACEFNPLAARCGGEDCALTGGLSVDGKTNNFSFRFRAKLPCAVLSAYDYVLSSDLNNRM